MTFADSPPPPRSSTILLVQSDELLGQKAKLDLQELGYKLLVVPTVSQLWLELARQHPAMILVDQERGGESSIKVCQMLRQRGYTQIILMLLGQETVSDRVACLEAGADDYLVKPYRAESFLQRIRFYLQPQESPKEQLQFSNLTLDLGSRQLRCGHKTIDLTMKEFELLKYLMSSAGEVLSREQILNNVWGYDFQGESNIIEVYIRYLRLKIEGPGQKRLIHTVRGVGYVLRET
ncbi:MAG: response regulator transcription factor NblR [Microcystaceae cyanobacterium]